MSYHEYKTSQEISAQDYPFYALIMAAMRQADGINIHRLRMAFPEKYEELKKRYDAPGGKLEGE